MRRCCRCLWLVLVMAPAGLSPALASDFRQVFQTRTDTMNAIDKSLKLVADMVKGTKPFDADKAREAARAIAADARGFPELFPPDSNPRPSEARAEIWRDWGRFVGLSANLAEKADLLAAASDNANGASDISASLLRLGRACSNCHDSYRAHLTD